MDFVLKNSNRKTVVIEIAPDGTLLVRAPLYYTKKQAEEAIKNSEKWISKTLPKIENKRDAIAQLTKEDVVLAKKGLEIICNRLIKEYAPFMNVNPTGIKITSAKKRFGSCAYNNSICFSYLLMLQPFDAIRYVVVHELAHIKYHNHSLSFHSFVSQTLKNADKYEKLLAPEYTSYANFKENLEILRKIGDII